MIVFVFFFFFSSRRRHTIFDCDWSSDVCSSDLALALHALVRTRYPQDSIQVIGFSNYARELRETDLAGLGWDMVQGTNLHHALVLAGRYLDHRPEHDPVVLIVTDGEPTAHLR